MTVLCRFECWDVKERKDWKGDKQDEEITLSAVTSMPESEDNAEVNNFSEYTPSGKFEMVVTNPAVFGSFIPGNHYYLEIKEVPMEKQPQWIQDRGKTPKPV